MKTSRHFAGKRQQQGVSFITVIIMVAILAFAGVIGAQVVPTYIEFLAIQKAVKRASGESTVPAIRSTFDKTAAVDDIKSVAGKDLDIAKNGSETVVKFAYNRDIHLGGPAYLVMKYEGSNSSK